MPKEMNLKREEEQMRKKLTAAVLALALILGMIPGASAAELARASTQSVEVDGTPVEFQMYALVDENGGLTNYVKLRDVAHVLNSTPARLIPATARRCPPPTPATGRTSPGPAR